MKIRLKILGLLILSMAFLHSCKKDEDKLVEGITLNATTLELEIDSSFQLIATVSPSDADNKAVNWASSDNAIATVDATGKVIALKTGKATITATTQDGNKTATCKLTIMPMKMVFVKGGTFMMGSVIGSGHNDEHPQHEVTLNDFYIGKYEVTNAQYVKFLNAKGKHEDSEHIWLDIIYPNSGIELVGGKYKVKSGKENYPVTNVTWYGAVAYTEWAGCRLLTEAEWEYASLGGNQSKGYKYSGSDNIDEVAWYYENSTNPDNLMVGGKGTYEVGSKQPNELGIYDMTGNVWEWCNDWYGKDYYTKDAQTNPVGPETGVGKTMRGGSFFSYKLDELRLKYRGGNTPTKSSFGVGFRIVVEPSEER